MRAAALAMLLCCVASPGRAQEDFSIDRFLGRWSLQADHSHYAQASPPEQMTLLIEPAAEGIAYRSEARFVGGRTAATQFVARLDGTPALVVGSTGFLAPVALAPAVDGGIDAVYRSGFKKVAWSHWSVSTDGRELTIMTTSLGAQGEETRNVAAFRRSDP